jgi:hypothetical protein
LSNLLSVSAPGLLFHSFRCWCNTLLTLVRVESKLPYRRPVNQIV